MNTEPGGVDVLGYTADAVDATREEAARDRERTDKAFYAACSILRDIAMCSPGDINWNRLYEEFQGATLANFKEFRKREQARTATTPHE